MSDRASQAASELVEHVDAEGLVLEVVTREEIRRGRLRHRCTYVAVIDSADQLVVHKRADWKDVYPGWWDIAFGGICDVGEEWLDAAGRELQEEAGLTAELEFLSDARYEAEDGVLLGKVYLARTDAELTCPDNEVVATDRVPLEAIDIWLEDRDVCLDSRVVVLPCLRELLNKS